GSGSRQAGGLGADVVPAVGGDGRAEVAHAFGAEQGAECAGGGEAGAAEVAGEEAGGPGVAGAGGVEDGGGGHGGDAVELVAAGDVGAVGAHFYAGDAAVGGESAGVGGVVVAEFGLEGADLVLVGEAVAEALGEWGGRPVARGVPAFEGAEVGAEGAAAAGRGVDDGVGGQGVETAEAQE